MNLVLLKGNLARDPELRNINTSNGKSTSVVNFTVAVSREYTKADGKIDQVTTFVPCEAWDTGAENIGSSFRKGDLVMLEGSLRKDSWEKELESGEKIKQSTMKIRVSNFAKITRNPSKKSQSDKESLAF
jgi:single-strand DNA-binding protein